MKLKRVKTYQAVEFKTGRDISNVAKHSETTFDLTMVDKYPDLKMEILASHPVVRVKSRFDDRIIPLANVEYAIVAEESEAPKASKSKEAKA